MGDSGIPDQVSDIKQLAKQHRWIDSSRVGVWGHSGGGFASTRALLTYPDFYSVAVSQAGNHDNRNYADEWGEKYHGMLITNEDGSTNYDSQANQLIVDNLKGKLLIFLFVYPLICRMTKNITIPQIVRCVILGDKNFSK